MTAIALSLSGYVIVKQGRSKKEQNGDVLCPTTLTAAGLSLDLVWVGHARARPVDFVLTVAVVASIDPVQASHS
jgi:hypothetical protein